MIRHTAIHRTIGRATLLAGGMLTVTLVAACSGPSDLASSVTSSSAVASTVGVSSPAGGGAGTTEVARVAECKAGDLQLSHGSGDGAAGHVYESLRFTNISGRPCLIGGFPGVSYVTGTNGQQVGAPAQRDGSAGPAITLAPGAVASAQVTMTDVGVFDPAVCQPTPTNGLRVYPPDDTTAMFVAQDGTGCAGNPPEAQLRVQTVKAGPGGP